MTEATSMTETGSYVLESDPSDDLVVLGLHGTDYRLELTPTVAPADFPLSTSNINELRA